MHVAAVTGALADAMSLDPTMRATIILAAALHDVGKLTLPARLWTSSAPLPRRERCLAQRHSVRGHALLRDLDPPVAQLVADAALTHHEAWDGSGYPGGLCGTEIPLVGRMVGLCDVYSALREARPYKQSVSHADAVEMLTAPDPALRTHRGMFDPDLLSIFLAAGTQVQAAFESPPGDADGSWRHLMQTAVR
ncbi:MAG: HD domain-containing protein [Rhodospirillales bacterium]|nr:HD domain-containing protein [Rhodospirillales bacterium]